MKYTFFLIVFCALLAAIKVQCAVRRTPSKSTPSASQLKKRQTLPDANFDDDRDYTLDAKFGVLDALNPFRHFYTAERPDGSTYIIEETSE